RLESGADGRRDTALPDDRVGNRLARGLVPDNGRLALIRDADGADLVRGNPRLGDRLPGRGQLRRPDGFRIVFDVARRGEDLRKLLLGRGDEPAVLLENDRAARRRALIERKNERAHHAGSAAGWCRSIAAV